MVLCGKSSGFADCENTVDRGSAVIFDADCGLCLYYARILDPKRNLDHNLSSALISMLMSSSKWFLFSKDVHLLMCETLIGIVLCSVLNKNFGGTTNLAKKRHGSADLHTPIHPPLYSSARKEHCWHGQIFLNCRVTKSGRTPKQKKFQGFHWSNILRYLQSWEPIHLPENSPRV